MAATNAVLQTTELLEAILLRTTSSEIIVATNVSSQWRSVVENSVRLKKELLWYRKAFTIALLDDRFFPNIERCIAVHTEWSTSQLYVFRLPTERIESYLYISARQMYPMAVDRYYAEWIIDHQDISKGSWRRIYRVIMRSGDLLLDSLRDRINLLARFTMTASDRVLNNFELLESIPVFSSLVEIQVATDVCTFFRNVVENSVRIQARVDYLALFQPEYAPKPSPTTPNNRAHRRSLWHFFVRTTYDEPVVFLRIPSKHMESILISERHQKYLRVLLGKERKCCAQIITNMYGRNVRIWDANEKWVCNTAAVSRRVLDGQSRLAKYLSTFYSLHEQGEIFEMGRITGHGNEFWRWAEVVQVLSARMITAGSAMCSWINAMFRKSEASADI